MTCRTLLGTLALLAVAGCAQVVPPPPTITRTPPQSAAPAPLAAPEVEPVPEFTVSHYDLDLKFNFPAHQLDATAQVTLTPNQTLATAAFHLNQNLTVDSVTDGTGKSLGQQRQSDQILVTFPSPQAAQTPIVLKFHYAGALADARLSPISGIRAAYVGPEGAFLLYPGEWFPLAGYGTDRFSATVTANLPAAMRMLASGTATTAPAADGTVATTFTQTQATFPGSVIVTPLAPQSANDGGLQTSFYVGPDVPAALVAQYTTAVQQIYTFLSSTFGSPPTPTLTFVELPADALPSFSSPGLIVLSRTAIGTAVNTNLLVDEIAQQWWGLMLSPRSLNDAWLQYGAARFSESLYVQHTEGLTAWQDLIQQLEVGALSYPETALSHSRDLYVFSPQFQDLNYDKGAMLFHMLRWQLGEQPFNDALRNFVYQNAWKSVSTAQFEQALEQSTKTDLRSFFTQWYNGTSVPTFNNQYTIYRLGKGGFRVIGKITQDLDLFNMPVEVALGTDGATASTTVQVAGTSTDFTIDSQARPVKVTVDPSDWILKSSPELKLRVDLSRGDNQVAAGDFPGAITQYKAALGLNPISSLAHYRLAEAYYQEQDWQDAANEYRQAMNGDLNPAWVTVWSHLQLGKIFDQTGQRDRALNEYQLAIATHDDTNGAQDLAQQYLKAPYKAVTASTSGN